MLIIRSSSSVVSRAFQILSDEDKKSRYDKFGGDPESRFGAGSSSAGESPFARGGFPGSARAGTMYEDEISPEEIFARFFGGGGFGGGFGPFGGLGGGLGEFSLFFLPEDIWTMEKKELTGGANGIIYRRRTLRHGSIIRLQHGRPRNPRASIRRSTTHAATTPSTSKSSGRQRRRTRESISAIAVLSPPANNRTPHLPANKLALLESRTASAVSGV